MFYLWWVWLLIGVGTGFLLGVFTTGRVLKQLYADRITFLEYNLLQRGVEVETSMR